MQISGNAVIFQLGKETTYGTAAAATQQVAISSESVKPTYSKVDEGLATGGRGEGRLQTMGKRAAGSISTLLRPDMGLFLELLCGKTAQTGGAVPYTHTYTASPADELRPSATLIIDRVAAVYGYTGAKINSMSLSASSGEYAKVDFEFNAKDEGTGTKVTTLRPSSLKAFRFAGGSMKLGTTAVADIKSIKIDWNNNDDVETQTTSTGENYLEPQQGVRQITVETELIWNADSKALLDAYFKTDDTVAIEVKFTSDQKSSDGTTPYSLTIAIPCAQCTDGSANMGSPTEFLQQSMNFKAIDNLSDELCTLTLVNDIDDNA